MQRKLKVCIFNAQPDRNDEFQELVQQVRDAEIYGLVSDWEMLRRLVATELVDAILMNLDDDLEARLDLVKRVLRTTPDMGIVGVSAASDPQTIIRAMRAGCAQFVCSPVDARDLNDAFERVRSSRLGGNARAKRICIMGATGGAGATTIACNLALELAHLADCPVGLVDLHLEFGDITCALDLEPRYTISDLCQCGDTVDRSMVQAAMHALPSNVSILSGPKQIAEAGLVTASGVKQVLGVMGSLFPFVIVDTPRSFQAETAAALEGADLVMIVTQLSVSGVRSTTRIYDYLLDLGAPEEALEIVVNRFKAEHGIVTTADVEEHFGRPVFAKVPNDYKQVMSALDLGHPISAQAPASAVRMAIQGMARSIASDGQTADDARRKRGLIGRLFAR